MGQGFRRLRFRLVFSFRILKGGSNSPRQEQFMAASAQQAYAELIRRTREAGVLGSCGSVLGWDESTYMPRNGSAWREPASAAPRAVTR